MYYYPTELRHYTEIQDYGELQSKPVNCVYDSRYVKICGPAMHVSDLHEHKAMSSVCAIAPMHQVKCQMTARYRKKNSERHRPPNVF
jgi:hypothetical protein